MGTRSGDIDPALIAYLERVKKLSVAQIDNLLNKKSGLLGLSGKSNDVRSVLAAEAEGDPRAALAITIYCYRVKKYIGAYTAALLLRHAELPIWAGIPLGGLVAVGFALLLGGLTLRLRAIYFAIATLAFAEVLKSFAHHLPTDFAGGNAGSPLFHVVLQVKLQFTPMVC
jgi:hypothetical protein